MAWQPSASLRIFLCAVLLCYGAGCSSSSTRQTGPATVKPIANQLSDGGLPAASSPREAEAFYREQIARDEYSGPAYNNLGVALLSQGQLADAAASLETARRLLPDVAHPRVNLGLVYLAAGKLELAREAAESGLAVAPSCQEAKRLLVVLHERGIEIDRKVLEDVGLSDTDSRWRQLARERLAVNDAR